jgi:hypothetical protein
LKKEKDEAIEKHWVAQQEKYNLQEKFIEDRA